MSCAPSRSKAVQKSGLSTSRMTSRQTGHKMSSAHGTGPSEAGKSLRSSGGPGRIGQDCKGFATGYGSAKKKGPIN